MMMKSVTSKSSQPRMLKFGSMPGQPMPTMQRIKVGGDASKMGGMMRSTTSTSRTRTLPPMMRMGGFGKMGLPGMMRPMGGMIPRPPPVFKMTGTKARLVDAEQNENYHPTNY